MNTVMSEVIPYFHINEKKSKRATDRLLSDQEALIRTLDLMDFYRAIKNSNKELISADNDSKEWIQLEWKNDGC